MSEKKTDEILTVNLVESPEDSATHDPSPSVYEFGPQRHTWRGKLWDSLDYGKEERWLLFKLDSTLLFLGAAGVFLRYLDQNNITNAFVSGMKEELNMFGNELNYANACWSVGYIIGQLVCSVILTKLKAHYVLGFIEVAWAIITFATSAVKTYRGLYVARFFLGLIEAGHFPGIMYITASWYKKSELTKRSAIIQFCTGVGPMFSGYLQAAAYDGLDGVSGRSGWRWLFIVDGIISLPLALLTVVGLPDVPRQQSANWIFSQREVDLAKTRIPHEVNVKVTYTKKDFFRWFSTWHIYGFGILFTLMGLAGQASSSLPYWFKSYKGEFTVSQINIYPTPMYAIQVVSTVIYAYLSDNWLNGRRWLIIVWVALVSFPVNLALALLPVHPANRAGRWALYYLCGLTPGAAAQIWSWVNELLAGDPLKRAFVSTFMNALSYSFQAWFPIVLYPTQDQPYVKNGLLASTVFAAVFGFVAVAMAYIVHLQHPSGFFQITNIADGVEHYGDEDEEKAL
ncbi:unnamed protein product [Kuraishia capsulata CBS 1993]|uniref:Major facilitator superfamily (MFS) profile domain-containing protein n=1 Tax=Kuraishia capsulata CBS 1993 TaxID=1382522 RepID=W6MIN3_9ASCO|nr:uncharacterized protein KUCA_T00000197001 [Kuraishia capsulata CBS 1993]CDK24237.1 unnamed protein product [Kuraishia capsulata CBS 1993]